MKEIKKILNSKVLLISLSILTVILLVAGVTYAWFVWNSTDNTNITMNIGEYTVVTFTNGNNVTGDMYPVYNYTDSTTKTTFTLNNSYSNPDKVMMLHPYLDLTSLPTELKSTSFKYLIEDANHNIKAEGDFSTYNQGSTIAIEPFELPYGQSSYTFYIYLNGTVESDPSMIGKTFTGTLRVEAVSIDSPYNRITDFEYEIGTGDFEGYVILKSYIGESTEVVVADNYIIDETSYNTALKIGEAGHNTTFKGNKKITSVKLPSVIVAAYTAPWSPSYTFMENNLTSLFIDCTSLVNVPKIPNSVTNMKYTFSGCTNLVNAPVIPNSVTNMYGTFSGCTNLVNAPVIPNSVTDMSSTFSGCTNLVNAPVIPNSVTNMFSTFYGCTNLVNAPIIPDSVTTITTAFRGCTSLTGTVRINSINIYKNWSSDNAGYPFYDTTNNITVEVPAGSTTETSINANKPANVTVTTFTP